MILVNNLCDFHDLYSYFTLKSNHIHDKEVLQLSPLTFEFSVWLDHNGGIN